MGLSLYTRKHAQTIIALEIRLTETERELDNELEATHFLPYIKIFDLFGFGRTLKSLFLLNCYPFERFLIKGKPHTEKDTSKNGKCVTRHLSLREFQAFVGLSYSHLQSGNQKSKKFHGSKLTRTHLYTFIIARICQSSPARQVQTPLGQELAKNSQTLKAKGIHGKDAIIRTEFKLTRKLFYELWKELK